MKINAVALFALLSVSAFGVQAASHYSYPRQYQRAESPVRAVSPDQILRQGIDRLKGFLSREGRVTKAETREFLDQEMSNYFDFPYMARWAAGPMYKRMDDAQRVKYAAQMKAMFFSALARNLGSYSGTKPRIDIYRPRFMPYSKEVTVNARVLPRNGYPVRLQFRFYRGTEGWKVFDVSANGISAAAYYRKQFKNMIRRH